MGKFFYLPPNAKIVKWTKNSNAKSTNLTFESTNPNGKLLLGWLNGLALLLGSMNKYNL
jgi:hypothetical protein